MKRTIFLLLCAAASLWAQTAQPTENYQRISMATLLIQPENVGYAAPLRSAHERLQLLPKYNKQALRQEVLTQKGQESYSFLLAKNQIPQQLLLSWFAGENGAAFSMELIQKRGEYNASQLDQMQANMSQIGKGFLDQQAIELLQYTYLNTLEFTELKSWDEIYDAQDARRREELGRHYSPVKRTKSGFVAKVNTRFYRLNFDAQAQDYFYENCFIYQEDSPEIRQKKQKKLAEFPLELIPVDNFEYEITADQPNNSSTGLQVPRYKSQQELLDELMQLAYEKADFLITRKDPNFQVRTGLYRTKPLRGRIGKKEGLYSDSRYFVFEQEEINGEVVLNHKGVIRTKTIWDNTNVSVVDDPEGASVFYQVSGKKLREGFLLRESNDLGLGISLGYGMGALDIYKNSQGVLLGLDYNLTSLARFTGQRFIPSFRAVVDFQLFSYGNYALKKPDASATYLPETRFNFFRWSIGFRKDVYFARSMFLQIGVQYLNERVNANDLKYADLYNATTAGASADQKVQFSMHGVQPSLGLGTYVVYPLSIFVRANYDFIFNTTDLVLKNKRNYPISNPFENRHTLLLQAGLRIEF